MKSLSLLIFGALVGALVVALVLRDSDVREGDVRRDMIVPEATIEERFESRGEPTPQEETEVSATREATKESVMEPALDISSKNLTRVPDDVFKRSELVSLNVSENRLTGALQAEVRHLLNLRVLDLSDNQFTGVPAEVGQLALLEVLDLSNNELTGLPYELGNLQNLTTLDVRGNENISKADLAVIKSNLPPTVTIIR